jgi:hypothetical protein
MSHNPRLRGNPAPRKEVQWFSAHLFHRSWRFEIIPELTSARADPPDGFPALAEYLTDGV